MGQGFLLKIWILAFLGNYSNTVCWVSKRVDWSSHQTCSCVYEPWSILCSIILSMSCLLYVLYHFFFFFFYVFVFGLSFIFSFILHPSCIIFYPCLYLLFFPGESIPKSIPVCFVISIWLMCTFSGGEILPRAHS